MGRQTISGTLLLLVVALAMAPVAAAESHTEVPRQATPVGEASLTRNFYVIFDGSGSMSESLTKQCKGDKRFRSRLEGAKWAVERFLPLVPRDVNLGLWVFDSNGNSERVSLGPDNRAQFLGAVQKTRAGGRTPLTESIERGVKQLVQQRDKQLGYGEFRLIVVTDGQATGRPLPQAVAYARERRIPIYTIGLCLSAEHELRRYSVSYRAADSIEALKHGLEETLAETHAFDPQMFPGR
ncbi:MAG TPA: vWA domain-containing protein [Candidatus Tectomicrobia bacterium]|nr:vWA domain-containing protein [Candidatus Tectomicrobia bacterium]